MSEAREKYYTEESESWITISRELAHDYVTELEQQLSELKESQKQKQIIRLCERLDKAEQQNKQMIEALISAYRGDMDEPSQLKWIIESVTGKSIDEATK